VEGEAIMIISRRRNITFRRYGFNGELKRPMFHRFEVKGGVSVLDLLTDNITRCNGLLMRLAGKPTVDESKLPAPPQRSGLTPLPPGYYPKGDR
jgi:hypothetical protein